MNSKVINPDSTILKQSEGHWQKYLMLVLAKLAPGGVTITLKDIEKFDQQQRVLLTHGHVDSIEFKLITPADAIRIAAYEKTRKGTA